MTKSRQVQAEVKYLHNPKAIHFKIISKKNSTAKTMLTIFKININSSLSCKLMSSKHRLRLEAKISNKIVHSKKGLSTTLCTNWRVQVQDLPRHISPRNEQQENLQYMEYQFPNRVSAELGKNMLTCAHRLLDNKDLVLFWVPRCQCLHQLHHCLQGLLQRSDFCLVLQIHSR